MIALSDCNPGALVALFVESVPKSGSSASNRTLSSHSDTVTVVVVSFARTSDFIFFPDMQCNTKKQKKNRIKFYIIKKKNILYIEFKNKLRQRSMYIS